MAAQSPFLLLPAEIRNLIYHHLWIGTGYNMVERGDEGVHVFIEYTPRETALPFSDRDPLPPDDGLPYWILTCRQIYTEALDQFYLVAYCYAYFNKPLSGPPIPSRSAIQLNRVRKIGPTRQPPHRHAVVLTHIHPRVEKESPTRHEMYMNQCRHTVGNCMLLTLGKMKHAVKDITINVSLWSLIYEQEEAHDAFFAVDLSPLEKLGDGFDRVVFRVLKPYLRPESLKNFVRYSAAAFAVLQRELLRVATLMVGGSPSSLDQDNASGSTARDYLEPFMNRGRKSRDPYDWCLEVKRSTGPSRGYHSLTYPGLQYFELEHNGVKDNYYGPLRRKGNELQWTSRLTREVLTLTEPLMSGSNV
ncbi:hypothetical protein BU24DRAFT_45450 [Aaosphaeria arxii CBS 175.79]|uniref:Uncharacterized protein n=1 Tax=Aaosphaeria arxii CBS 175.79 TaxID=1450172 RepID=A0A6A5XCY0_9PLEO|nr:uncharacterized protein BU24DRAFT_45450 [Aaosphaeria arxii CBS 175.79]KAF2010761.1 hypothetical protein BU24DRAFT_45450 [Aaosphaeria arxii CBS 175.79]